jgi:hypothetical protein
MNAMHDECAFVHPGLRCGDKVFDSSAACPGCVDKGVGVKERAEIFPFAGITGESSA